MINELKFAASELKKMKEHGITLDVNGDAEDDYARLVTTDKEIADKFGMTEEERFDEDEECCVEADI